MRNSLDFDSTFGIFGRHENCKNPGRWCLRAGRVGANPRLAQTIWGSASGRRGHQTRTGLDAWIGTLADPGPLLPEGIVGRRDGGKDYADLSFGGGPFRPGREKSGGGLDLEHTGPAQCPDGGQTRAAGENFLAEQHCGLWPGFPQGTLSAMGRTGAFDRFRDQQAGRGGLVPVLSPEIWNR